MFDPNTGRFSGTSSVNDRTCRSSGPALVMAAKSTPCASIFTKSTERCGAPIQRRMRSRVTSGTSRRSRTVLHQPSRDERGFVGKSELQPALLPTLKVTTRAGRSDGPTAKGKISPRS